MAPARALQRCEPQRRQRERLSIHAELRIDEDVEPVGVDAPRGLDQVAIEAQRPCRGVADALRHRILLAAEDVDELLEARVRQVGDPGTEVVPGRAVAEERTRETDADPARTLAGRAVRRRQSRLRQRAPETCEQPSVTPLHIQIVLAVIREQEVRSLDAAKYLPRFGVHVRKERQRFVEAAGVAVPMRGDRLGRRVNRRQVETHGDARLPVARIESVEDSLRRVKARQPEERPALATAHVRVGRNVREHATREFECELELPLPQRQCRQVAERRRIPGVECERVPERVDCLGRPRRALQRQAEVVPGLQEIRLERVASAYAALASA